jgi:3-oxoacyl-[acyl-carrier protein] reductase
MVTGGAKGIGAAVGGAFAREGARVALLDVDGRALEALTASWSGRGVRSWGSRPT